MGYFLCLQFDQELQEIIIRNLSQSRAFTKHLPIYQWSKRTTFPWRTQANVSKPNVAAIESSKESKASKLLDGGLQEAKMGNNNPGIYNIGNLYVDMVYTYLHMYLTIYMYYVELCD